MVEAGLVEAPKKRGRKPKAVVEAADAAPKKRGRKPKAVTAAASDATAVPKRRGRPAKQTNTTDSPSAPKKRGRPAKSTEAMVVAPAKRGRKPKAAITGSVNKPAPQAKRGRKPKAEKPVRQKRQKIEKPFGDLIGLEAVLAAEKMMGRDPE